MLRFAKFANLSAFNVVCINLQSKLILISHELGNSQFAISDKLWKLAHILKEKTASLS